MARKYLKRLDVTGTRPEVDNVRGYLVKIIEAPTILELEVAVNIFLVHALTDASDANIHLVSTEWRDYGSGVNLMHVAHLTFYYVGDGLVQFTTP